MSRKRRSVALLSGGLDSSTLLYFAAKQSEVIAVSIDYGQKHRKELLAATSVAEGVASQHIIVKFPAFSSLVSSALTSSEIDVPEGHYTDKSMEATVVPNRNMFLLSIATGIAISQEADRVLYAAHAGDHAIYPDCRPEFVTALASTILLANLKPVTLDAPFINIFKEEIVGLGVALGVPYGKTWSCYKGGEFHCGKCGTCVERREAFELAGAHDPTAYE